MKLVVHVRRCLSASLTHKHKIRRHSRDWDDRTERCLFVLIPSFIDNNLRRVSRILEDSVWRPSTALQKHPVLVDVNRPEGITIRTGLDHPLQRDVVSAGRVRAVASVVVVSRHEAHHTLMRAQHGQQRLVVPGQTDGVRGVWVNGEMTCTQTQYKHQVWRLPSSKSGILMYLLKTVTFSCFWSARVKTSSSHTSCSWLNPPLNFTNLCSNPKTVRKHINEH